MSMVEVGKTAELFTEAGVRFPMTRFRLVLDAIIWNFELLQVAWGTYGK